jgi:hypothetical protein
MVGEQGFERLAVPGTGSREKIVVPFIRHLRGRRDAILGARGAHRGSGTWIAEQSRRRYERNSGLEHWECHEHPS